MPPSKTPTLQEIEASIKQLTSERDTARGRYQAAMQRLKELVGADTFEAARRELEAREAKARECSATYQQALDAFVRDFPDVL